MSKLALSLLVTTMLAGCSLAPDFKMPEISMPQQYKESPPAQAQQKLPEQERGRWKKAEDLESAQRGEWWNFRGPWNGFITIPIRVAEPSTRVKPPKFLGIVAATTPINAVAVDTTALT
jgi:hypothetical protein